MKDMNNILSKIYLLQKYMQPVIVRYQFNDNKQEVVLSFPRTSFHLTLPNFPLAFFNDNLDKCPDSLVTAGY